MGFNVVRLGYMWAGVMPEEGVYNQTYISIIKTIVKNLSDRGIYTLLDMHQDVLSSKFCNYDGVPLWVINKSKPFFLFKFPFPFSGNCSARLWSTNYLSHAVGLAFQDIYENTNGMRDDLVNFWTYSAKQFADSDILGYEFMNEPFAGNVVGGKFYDFIPHLAGILFLIFLIIIFF